jgi:hypothetical protein
MGCNPFMLIEFGRLFTSSILHIHYTGLFNYNVGMMKIDNLSLTYVKIKKNSNTDDISILRPLCNMNLGFYGFPELLQILNEMTINKTPCMHCTELTLQQ